MERLAGKTVWITGAARGIGRAIAVTFAQEGADLLLTDICQDIELCPYPLGTQSQLEETAVRCRSFGHKVVTYSCDVRDAEQVSNVVKQGLDVLGKLDALINNAGIVGPGGRPAHTLTEDEWLVVIDVNLNGAWRCAKAVLPAMVSQRGGSITNISSTGGLIGFRSFSSYIAAKHGVIGLTKAMAVDYANHAIRVNTVCPTSVKDNPNLDSMMLNGVAKMYGVPLDAYEEMSKQYHPLQTLIDAEDVAWACVFLASDQAKRITGATIPVDAGFTVK